MAEGKSSVIVYRDWITIFDDLTDDEAGKLIKHFFRYVNDLNPEPPDRVIGLLFKQIQLTLKRDLKKWESIREKRSEAGKVSAAIRKQNQQVLTSVESVQQTSTNSTVSVTVSDSVTVSVNDNKYIIEFENFRKLYPGKKRGSETEFTNFKKKHKDWKEVLPNLEKSITGQIEARDRKIQNKQFVPEWKNLQTWINQRCWEEEPEVNINTGQIPQIAKIYKDPNSLYL